MIRSLRYPGDEQSRLEQIERETVRQKQHAAEEAERIRIYNATPRPPDWWNRASSRLRRGIIFALRSDGATFVEIAEQLVLSSSRVQQLFRQAERRIWMSADARFPVGHDWSSYRPPSADVRDDLWTRRFLERR